ncbi:MAG: hypothetical protein LBT37_06300 [Lactobacillaceae bacterium]|nr:hypothetical protein [Lactobacillaceae bacterium]
MAEGKRGRPKKYEDPTEGQRLASAKWQAENRSRKQYLNTKSTAKRFILNVATDEDINLVQEWLAERTSK